MFNKKKIPKILLHYIKPFRVVVLVSSITFMNNNTLFNGLIMTQIIIIIIIAIHVASVIFVANILFTQVEYSSFPTTTNNRFLYKLLCTMSVQYKFNY